MQCLDIRTLRTSATVLKYKKSKKKRITVALVTYSDSLWYSIW